MREIVALLPGAPRPEPFSWKRIGHALDANALPHRGAPARVVNKPCLRPIHDGDHSRPVEIGELFQSLFVLSLGDEYTRCDETGERRRRTRPIDYEHETHTAIYEGCELE